MAKLSTKSWPKKTWEKKEIPPYIEKPFSPSPQQEDFFSWVKEGTGSCILEAVAGSGKTTTLVHSMKLMQGNVCALAFNKTIAEEIGSRVSTLSNISSSTCHSAGLSIWKDHHNSRIKVDSWKVTNLFRNLFTEENDSPFQKPVVELVSYAKQGAYSLEDMENYELWEALIDHYSVDTPEGDDESTIGMARELLLHSNRDLSTLDFDDMIYFPVLHNIKPATQYDWVLIDEAQDTNYSRRKLALLLLKSDGRLEAVGDRHQAIYGFTGASSNALDLIRSEVNATTLPLTVTYRCPQAVVEEARKYVPHITAHSGNSIGEVSHLLFPELFNAQAGDAILCRVNAPLVDLVYKFISKGIGAKVEGRAIGEGLRSLLTKHSTVTSFNVLNSRIDAFEEREVTKLEEKKFFTKAATLRDKIYCLRIIIQRAQSRNSNSTTPVSDVLSEIASIFGDNLSNCIILSSIHKAKGKEWNNVYYLTTPTPKRVSQDWELEQETNLTYVAITRAMKKLFFVEYQK